MAEFQSFAARLKAPPVLDAPASPQAPAQPPAEPPPPPPPPKPPGADPQVTMTLKSFLVEMRRLRARAGELFEADCEAMLEALAREVLGRELQLAPADLRGLTKRFRDEIENDGMQVRVCPADAVYLSDLGPLEPDPALHPGDLVIITAEGRIDLRIGSRLKAILESRRIQT